jgi:hypothetical protein
MLSVVPPYRQTDGHPQEPPESATAARGEPNGGPNLDQLPADGPMYCVRPIRSTGVRRSIGDRRPWNFKPNRRTYAMRFAIKPDNRGAVTTLRSPSPTPALNVLCSLAARRNDRWSLTDSMRPPPKRHRSSLGGRVGPPRSSPSQPGLRPGCGCSTWTAKQAARASRSS